MGVACSYSSAPAPVHGSLIVILRTFVFFVVFFRLIDTTVTVCKGTSVNQPVTALIGENVWRSLGRAWKLTWFLDGQVITMCMIETRNMKSLFTLGMLVQRTET